MKHDEKMKHSQDYGHTQVNQFLVISFILKMIKVLIFMISFSYFFGMAFKLLIDIQSDLMNWDDYRIEGLDFDPETGKYAN